MNILEIILPFIIQIESGGCAYAVGDNGEAVGILQIHKCVVDDVNRIQHDTTYTYDDRYNKDKSIEMFYIYSDYYYHRYLDWSASVTNMRTFVRKDEIVARIWNGGYDGTKYMPKYTDSYWKKLKRAIDKLEVTNNG